ncbi:aminoglycoside 6-adenylyltransferase [Alicyclobacillus contaminans]|uniref:aminoglycoside 6-adenylyltransferase n=1 Tax=Alicyclobacillus contaminans TaxID=392016 RepID=UPI0003F9494E|nr:aminoglycoside 6-adenylyltransferase [Alicyclobacillus contaminans]GMA51603.1 aminoglycoside 6-adenylyltransferase [Alicyclobacillus contaminans]
MRNEREMMGLIRTFAEQDERVRAVIMNSSRVNSSIPRDILQDYDVVFLVSRLDAFIRDRTWIQHFGKLIIMQTPDENVLFPNNRDGFAFLMLFEDGNRIDLTLYPVEKKDQYVPDSLSVVLMDKDNLLHPLPEPSDLDYRISPPTKEQFACCCNEFWWTCTYVAKGVWREQLPYANFMLEHPVRSMLSLMLKWYIGMQTNFAVNVGACGKYFEKYLDPRIWTEYVQTFPNGTYENMWRSLFVLCGLFRKLATAVGHRFGYDYPVTDDENVTNYLLRLRELPKDADSTF